MWYFYYMEKNKKISYSYTIIEFMGLTICHNRKNDIKSGMSGKLKCKIFFGV